MLEARVLSLIGAALLRLRRHPPRTCEVDARHGAVEPELGSLELSIIEPDAAAYTCSNDRCGWRRLDRLKPEEPADVTEKFTIKEPE
jgi:hypothetical protein